MESMRGGYARQLGDARRVSNASSDGISTVQPIPPV
jgi:hypothetical protein